MLFAATAVELVFAACCINLRSYQATSRSVIRIVALAAFGLLMIVSIVEWSVRWYAFAALLLIWALLGAIALLRKTDDGQTFRTGNVIRRSVLTLLAVLLALSPALIFPQYKPLEITGEYGVETVTYTYIDGSRVETYSNTGGPRKLTVQYWYPENAAGKHPLVVFSHGSFGVKSSNLSLYRDLASHGYVVCSIDHTYQCLVTIDSDGNTSWLDRGFMHEVSAEDAKSDKAQSYGYYRKWMGIRTGDISFVIDYALSQAASSDPNHVYALIDTTKIGVMGHSLGGSAALGIGRTRDDVGAVIALESPFLCDIVGVGNGEFAWNEEAYPIPCDIVGVGNGEFAWNEEAYPIPVLNIYSDSSWNHLDEWPQYAVNSKLLVDTGATAYNVHMQGAGHLTLTDLALTSPFLTRMLNGQRADIDTRYCLTAISQLALEFFDCYLKGKGEFAPQAVYSGIAQKTQCKTDPSDNTLSEQRVRGSRRTERILSMEFIPAKTIVSGYADGSSWFGDNYNMNIYKGCCHGCIYCDSRSECYRIEDFDQVRAKENALALIARELRSKRRKGVIGTGAMSDPYNPFEQDHRLTRGALELIDAQGFGISIATKSDLVTRDIDVLTSIKTHSPVLVKITVTTADDELCRKVEPRAPVASRRLSAIRQLAADGVFTGILMMPVLPFIEDNEDNVVNIVRLAGEAGARFIYPAFGVTLRQNQREWYYSKLDEHFPGLRYKYAKQFGNAYECSSPRANELWRAFKAECDRFGILYRMEDIIEAYCSPYRSAQLSLF